MKDGYFFEMAFQGFTFGHNNNDSGLLWSTSWQRDSFSMQKWSIFLNHIPDSKPISLL